MTDKNASQDESTRRRTTLVRGREIESVEVDEPSVGDVRDATADDEAERARSLGRARSRSR